MCLEILSLSASSFPEHLYVFVVLMNGTKVSGGPRGREGGNGPVRERAAVARLEVESAEWSAAMRLTVREQKTAGVMET